jgi:hypothetical protein
MILTHEVARLKKNLPKYRWQHLKKRGAELKMIAREKDWIWLEI